MSKSLYLVFSKPPESVTSEEYDRWYHDHVRENIETKGFLSAERYALKAGRPTGVDFRHLAVYEYTGDYQALREDLERRIEAGKIVLPEWFPQIQFGSWECRAIDERAEAPG